MKKNLDILLTNNDRYFNNVSGMDEIINLTRVSNPDEELLTQEN